MGKRVQFIRHTTGLADAFTGLLAEITVDTTRKELRVHDGLTAGGIAVARQDLDNVNEASTSIAGKMTAAQVVELTLNTVQTGVNATTLGTHATRLSAIEGIIPAVAGVLEPSKLLQVNAGGILDTLGVTNLVANFNAAGDFSIATVPCTRTMADINDLATKNGTETLIGKTINSAIINSATINSGTYTGSFGGNFTLNGTVTFASQAVINNHQIDNGPAFRAYRTTTWAIPASVTVIPMTTESFDTAADYNTGTYRFQPSEAGIYEIYGQISVIASTAGTVLIYIYKNGANIAQSSTYTTSATIDHLSVRTLVSMNGSTDYVDMRASESIGVSQVGGGTTNSFFEGHRVRRQ